MNLLRISCKGFYPEFQSQIADVTNFCSKALDTNSVVNNFHRLAVVICKNVPSTIPVSDARLMMVEAAKFVVPTGNSTSTHRAAPRFFTKFDEDRLNMLQTDMGASIVYADPSTKKGQAQAAKRKSKTGKKNSDLQEEAVTLKVEGEGGQIRNVTILDDIYFTVNGVMIQHPDASPEETDKLKALGYSLCFEFVWGGQVLIDGTSYKTWSLMRTALRAMLHRSGKAAALCNDNSAFAGALVSASSPASIEMPNEAEQAGLELSMIEGLVAEFKDDAKEFTDANSLGAPAFLHPAARGLLPAVWAEASTLGTKCTSASLLCTSKDVFAIIATAMPIKFEWMRMACYLVNMKPETTEEHNVHALLAGAFGGKDKAAIFLTLRASYTMGLLMDLFQTGGVFAGIGDLSDMKDIVCKCSSTWKSETLSALVLIDSALAHQRLLWSEAFRKFLDDLCSRSRTGPLAMPTDIIDLARQTVVAFLPKTVSAVTIKMEPGDDSGDTSTVAGSPTEEDNRRWLSGLIVLTTLHIHTNSNKSQIYVASGCESDPISLFWLKL